MESLSQVLYGVSTILLVPVMIVLLSMLAWECVILGGFLREWTERGRLRRHLAETVRTCERLDRAALWRHLKEVRLGLLVRFRAALPEADAPPEDPGVLDHAFTEVENGLAKSVAVLTYLTRLGPMLGLMGTLIPLGPALTGLAGGNMQELSSNLVVAFTTTITGLFVSALAFTMGLARRVWYEQDLADLEFLVARLKLKDALHA